MPPKHPAMSPSIAKKTRKSFTLEVKLDIIHRRERGEKTNSMASHHGLTPFIVYLFKSADFIKKDKVQQGVTDRIKGGLVENKLKELRNEWKLEQEEEKVKFSEVIKRQIQENTKVAVIEVIKEKGSIVRDAVDKKKSFVIYGMREKKNPNRLTREREEREMAKTVIKRVQESTQEFDQEVEEVVRLGRYTERGKRPMKVKMRSQVAVEEIMTRKGKLANDVNHKEMWIKKDMNLEEREKEKVLRSEDKEKKQEKGQR
ncbi:hypothetical protein E2C01_054044 [Portunus trituberculatus]|uniref:Uncharacterized protein n=1 Tax=Portunus trituberculatus TaxID=210409 RepID=A0A5B7GQZ4_PORTR|nr:hypothetical protein [Portunus trituberculatus]